MLRLADVTAYYRRVRRGSATRSHAGRRPSRTPATTATSATSGASATSVWEERDHLHRVAGMRRDQISRWRGRDQDAGRRSPRRIRRRRCASSHPTRSRPARAGRAPARDPRGRLDPVACGPVEDGCGFSTLPPPSPGDIILDLEGTCSSSRPAGSSSCSGSSPAMGASRLRGRLGARPRGRARGVHARDRCHPRAARALPRHARLPLRRLREERPQAAHGRARPARGGGRRPPARRVFVNLYTTLRQALRVGVPSYSLKELEALAASCARPTSARATTPSSASRVAADARRRPPRRDRRLQRGGLPRDARAPRLAARAAARRHARGPTRSRSRARGGEAAGDRGAGAVAAGAGRGRGARTPRWLAGELLEYHRREARPAWWAWFDRWPPRPRSSSRSPRRSAASSRSASRSATRSRSSGRSASPSRSTSSSGRQAGRPGDG